MARRSQQALPKQVSVIFQSQNGRTFAQVTTNAGSIWAPFAYSRIVKVGQYIVRINPRMEKLRVERSTSIFGPFSSSVNVSIPDNWELRHVSASVHGTSITLYYTRIGDAPERIYRASIDTSQPWGEWALTNEECVRQPELPWEGAQLPVQISTNGPANSVNQLRDPFIYDDGPNRALFYSYSGESGIAVATLTE